MNFHSWAILFVLPRLVLSFHIHSIHTSRYRNAMIMFPSTAHKSLPERCVTNLARFSMSGKTCLKANTLADNEPDELISTKLKKKIASTKIVESEQAAPQMNATWKARFLIILAASLYGTNYTFVKILHESMSTELGIALRFSLAAIATLPWFFQGNDSEFKSENISSGDMHETVKPSSSISSSYGAILGGAEVGLWNAIGYAAQAVGLETTPASTSAFMCSLTIAVVPLLDVFVGKRILPREFIGALLAIAGISMLELDNLQLDQAEATGNFLLSTGTLYSLMQPVFFGIGYWRMEHHTRSYPDRGMQLTSAQLVSIALLMIGSFIIKSEGVGGLPDWSSISAWSSNQSIIGAIMWTGLVTTAFTIFIETQALKTLRAAEATVLFSTEPIFGSIFACTMLGESLGIGGGIGAAMVIGGCLFSNLEPGSDTNDS